MGFACPVCEAPQADAGHLANHLAFTAIARGGDHETWLDDRVPGWDELGEATLADRVVEHASETEYPQVFEDTTGDGASSSGSHTPPSRGAVPETDADVEAVVEEARELTRRRRDESETE